MAAGQFEHAKGGGGAGGGALSAAAEEASMSPPAVARIESLFLDIWAIRNRTFDATSIPDSKMGIIVVVVVVRNLPLLPATVAPPSNNNPYLLASRNVSRFSSTSMPSSPLVLRLLLHLILIHRDERRDIEPDVAPIVVL
eukprot:CAMPEP_0181079974 /NCGR_PEP_ID=MMETSP1071-20121207/2316_1 /TAXON_ID=35127 /ORGANISM="Thalassiosira sp., Strain NH16" /LENGTH=139 /DNA_ID=CAMNT_0023161413 /DNA_START=724 /DNA_END=1144 /DNA_ORIENTATION=+